MPISRRAFCHRASATALAFAGLRSLLQGSHAQEYIVDPLRGVAPFGPLLPDPNGLVDLPKGFSSLPFSASGEIMSDGLLTPGRHDGMATFAIPGAPGKCALVRNHELPPEMVDQGPFRGDRTLLARIDSARIYDFNDGGDPLPGGTTTLIYDLVGQRLERAWLSITGMDFNCAGGATPWGSWLTCEESDLMPGKDAHKPHGYVFEVPAAATGLVEPVPIKALGRFVHEAVAVDPLTGILYLTEDSPEALFYRFLPAQPGKLLKGGRLQALALRDAPGADLRNWPNDGSGAGGQGSVAAVGQEFAVYWIDIPQPESPDNDLRLRGHTDGALRFARGEGLAFGRDENGRSEFYFACTVGGARRIGQVFRYRPSAREGRPGEKDAPGQLQLFVESDNPAVLEHCDNVVVAPWGDILLCEDGRDEQYLRGVTPEGRLYTLARNAHPMKSEFAGACFSRDGATLFVNLQEPGITLAIRGPWPRQGKG